MRLNRNGLRRAVNQTLVDLEVNRSEPASVAVVTMTLARTRPETERLQRSLSVLAKAGYPIVIGEGGSEKRFVARLGRLRNVQIVGRPPQMKPTLVNQLKGAFSQALEMNPDYVLYTEPDKRAFFSKGLVALADKAQCVRHRCPSLVLAARSARALATYPEGQRIAEGFMNQLCGEALGAPGDYTYGPMLIHRRLLAYTQVMPENLGWGWRFYLMAVAHQLRLPVELITVASGCPASQRNEDDRVSRDYRLRQLTENVTGLANGWTCLLDPEIQQGPALVRAA